MIAFGCSMTLPEIYARYAGQGVERAAEPDSAIYAYQAAGSIFRSYNLILDQAAAHDDLEGLVLVHEDAEIVDGEFCAKLRRALADPQVAVVGCVGTIGSSSIAWWDGTVLWGSAAYRYGEAGGGELSAETWNGESMRRVGEVDTLHGFFMALSPWAVRNLRFDESLGQLHGYDFDFCLQARAAGRKVVVSDVEVAHHHSLALVGDPPTWVAAHMRVAEKWEGRMPGVQAPGADWKQRARRAEAEGAAVRMLVASKQYQADARLNQSKVRLEEVTKTPSWRLTAPLRRLNALRKAALSAAPGGRRTDR